MTAVKINFSIDDTKSKGLDDKFLTLVAGET